MSICSARLVVLLVCILSSGATLTAIAAEIGIITPEAVHAMITATNEADKPLVIDARGGYKDYFRGHLPRAHHLNFDTLRGTDQGVPVQYLPDDLTRALLVRAGVDYKRTHIIYATGDSLPNDEILSASMVAYVLEKHGIEDIRIVDGGLRSWIQAGLPVTQQYFGNPPGELGPSAPDQRTKASISITLDELIRLKTKPNVLLVDARPYNEYIGQDDVWLRKGHIPGAISFHWAKLMEADNTHRFRKHEVIASDLNKAGITPEREIIVYCGTSREGSLLRFYLTHVARYPNIRLYEGSWKEYASMPELPTETTVQTVTKE